jgi:3-methylcrotonyl-CoA carboxylase beta subunit
VGIVANNGSCFSESAPQGRRISSSCARKRGTPRPLPADITGFMVGYASTRRRRIAKDGAKMVTPVSCARVPKLT